MISTPIPASLKPVIVLLGNYALDREEGPVRFRDFMRSRLEADGYTVEILAPEVYVGGIISTGAAAKWLGYVDKYIVFPLGLLGQCSRVREKYLGRKIVVHICDHSNALFATLIRRWFPVVVTCHDLLALRENANAPLSPPDKLLRMEILHGLRRAHEVVCDSPATRDDLLRLAGGRELETRSEVIPFAPEDPGGALMRGYEDLYRRI